MQEIFPVRNQGNIDETIYVVQMPSTQAAYMLKDKKFINAS
jgi:hypothetical protein